MAEPGDPPVSEDPSLFDDESREEGVFDDRLFDDEAPSENAPQVATPAETVLDTPSEAIVGTISEPVASAWSPARIERHTASDIDPGHDDSVGFTSASSLMGARRIPASDRSVEDAEPDMFDAPLNRLAVAREARADTAQVSGIQSSGIPVAGGLRADVFGRSKSTDTAHKAPVEMAMSLFTVYALILFSVPTLGVAAVIALLAVTVRPRPQQPLARSHFEFQKRTLWIAGITAILGALLIVVNLGVFVLFIGAVWLLVRGAWGLLLLAKGEPIARPHQWLIAAR